MNNQKIFLFLSCVFTLLVVGCSRISDNDTTAKSANAPRPTMALRPTNTSKPTNTPKPQCPSRVDDVVEPNQSNIGKISRSYSEGFEEQESFLLGSNGRDFGLSHYQYEDKHYIWLEEFLCRDDDGKAYFRIVDELVITDLNEDEYVVMLFCKNEGADEDNEILATGYYIEPIITETARFEIKATRAWIINWQTLDFEEIPAGNVLCSDPHMP